MKSVSIIGIGRLGGALAVALSRQGCKIENLFVRNSVTALQISKFIEPKPQILKLEEISEISSDIIFITTQDSEIENAAADLVEKLDHAKPFIFHMSGSQSSEILHILRETDCPTGSIHPLVSLSDAILGAERFKDAYFCVEGEKEAVEIAEKIVSNLGGKSFSIETKYKTLYHASAVTASGHLVALIDTAIEMLSKCGLSEDQAKETLLPLVKSTVENLEVQTTAEALTGTFARADVATFEKHLAALDKSVSEEAKSIYLDLGERSTRLAERHGANAEKLAQIRDKISLAKKNSKC